MIRIHSKLITILVLGFISAATARAQVQIGTPPFGSFSGGPDIINNSNLNVHLAIPVMSKGGRGGMGFSYGLGYDSSIWYPAGNPPNQVWVRAANLGWQGVSETTTGYITYAQTQDSCWNGYQYIYFNIYTNWVYHDPNAATHAFGSAADVSTYTTSMCGHGAYPPNTATAAAQDGSGLTIQTVAATPSATIKTRSGVTVAAPLQYPSGSGSLTNPNSNIISTDGQNFTDSLGMTALQVSGTPPNPVLFKYYNSAGIQVSVTVGYSNLPIESNFGCSSITDYGRGQQINGNLVTSIAFPNGDSYQFTYEATPSPVHTGAVTGRIASITLPTGGTISYTYTNGSHGINCSDGSASGLTRVVDKDGSTPNTWNYTRSQVSGLHWQTTITDPASNQTVLDLWGLFETKRVASNLLTVDTCYNGNQSNCTTTAVGAPITRRTMTITPAGVSSAKRDEYYDSYGLPTRVEEFDYGASTFLRKTLITYTPIGTWIKDRPSSVVVCGYGGSASDCGGSGTVKAKTTYGYNTYGNLTSEMRSTGGTPANVSRSFTYSTSGVLQTATDFNSHQTTYTNTSCTNSFPTSVTMPLSLSRSITWNCNGGVPSTTTDVNNRSTSESFDDLWRVTQVTLPGGGQTNIDYSNLLTPTATTKLTASQNLVNTSYLDGLGRVTQSVLIDPEGNDIVDTAYDSLGRMASVSNPYRSTSSRDYGVTTYQYDALGRITKTIPPDGTGSANNISVSYSGNCTTVTDQAGKVRTSCADALGRVTSVTEDPLGLNYQTTYSYDTLDNLAGVSQGGQVRSYSYDLLSRVTQVITPEGGTVNFFYTTSGGALCSGDPNAVCRRDAPKPNQTNPATRVVTTYAFDALNRLTSKTYNDGTSTANYYYDETSYTLNGSVYTLTNTKGRLSRTSAAGGTAITLHSYDAAGRPSSYIQCTPYNCNVALKTPWSTSYTYNLAGDLATFLDVSGNTTTYTINDAGRVTSITNSLVNTKHPASLADNITYRPFGAIYTLTNGAVTGGTQRIESYVYNPSLQVDLQRLGDSNSWRSNFCFHYNYHSDVSLQTDCGNGLPSTGASQNNGSMLGYVFKDNTGTPTPNMDHQATLCYDGVNRMSGAIGQNISAATPTNCTSTDKKWSHAYAYDRWGNPSCSGSGLCTGIAYEVTNNNRIDTVGGASVTEDAAGNVIQDDSDAAVRYYAWDAEGRMNWVSSSSGTGTCPSTATSCFIYNALGQRVEIKNGAGTVFSEYAYDAFGNTIATHARGSDFTWRMYYLGGRPIAQHNLTDDATYFLHPNQLGSTTFVTDQTGATIQKTMYYPFGQVWQSGGTARDSRFASMDPTDSTGNNPTLFRMQHPRLYRWLSPDPLAGDIMSPQSLNRYAYAMNDPANFTDPMGLSAVDACEQFWPAWSPCHVNPPSAGNIGGWGGWGGEGNGGLGDGTWGQGQPGVSSLPCGVVYDAPGCSLGPPGTVDIGTIIIVTVTAHSPSPRNGTIGAMTPQEADDYLNDYCSDRGVAKFVADLFPGGGTIARRLYSDRLSSAELDRITEENHGLRTVAVHAASETAEFYAGADLFLSRLRARTGLPKTFASKWLGRISWGLIVADALHGLSKANQEFVNCKTGN